MKDLIEIDIQNFRETTRDITFDVYLKLSDQNFAHVFSRSTGLDYKRLAQYIQKGVTKLYIRNEDKSAYDAFISKKADNIFNDPNTPQEKKVATLLNMTEQNMTELFAQIEVNEKTAESTKKVIRNYVKLMGENPMSFSIILKLVSHGEYFYYHSIAVAIFSMFIAKASGQFNRRMLELVGLGGFLHDIGMTQLPKDLLESSEELTTEQWALVKDHPRIGMKMLEQTGNIPDEVRYIVYQHHEQPDGHGYPNMLRGPVIYHPAKIVALADAFSAMISKRPFRRAYTAEEAIATLEKEAGKYDKELVKILASIFNKPSSGKKAS